MEKPTPSTGARRTTARPLRDWGMPVASPRRSTRRLPHAALEPAEEANASGHARVLVVEDDPDTRRALLLALAEDLGEPIAPAADGEEALWVAAEAPPDVVVLDIGLPKHDGYEVIRQLRADPRTAGAWVIALTGTGSPREAARAGFDQFLWKPADLTHVALAVHAGLRRHARGIAVPDPEVEVVYEPEVREIEFLAERLGPLAEEVADATEDQMADIFERIERQLRD
jgi:CheY-like chemotaxis protein